MRSFLLPIVLLGVAKSSSFVDGSGNVGCLFSEELCRPESQWCYDDGAFGRCLLLGAGADDEIYRHNLQQDDLERLEYELGQLLENGYRWSHRHTQCVLQALLHSFRTGSAFERIICDRLKEKDLESALNSGDVDDEGYPESLANTKYGPNDNDQSPDFARIVYYSTKERNPDDGVYGVEEDVEYDEPYTLVRRSLPSDAWESDHFSTLYNTPDHFRSGFELKDLPGERLLREAPKEDEDSVKEDEDYYDEDSDFMVPIRDKISSVVPPNFLESPNIVDDWNKDDDDDDEDDDDIDSDDKPLFLLPGSDQPSQYGPIFDSPASGVDEGYTEGGVISIPNAQGYQEMQDMQDSWLESLGFKRRERLDVKKPGPPYDPAFQKKLTTMKPKHNETDKKQEGQKEDILNALPMQPVKQVFSPKSRSVKKIVDDEIADNSQYDVIDTTYTYIEFRNDIETWREGRAIVDKVAELLKVPKELFTKERVDRNEVTFQVKEPNSYGLNGTEVAKKIESIKDDLGRTAGVFITGYGIGNKSKLPSAERLDMRPDHEVYVVTVIVCGVLAALALSAGVLYLTRRHGYKLANMTSGDTESSKLYQDLCRARMSSKNTTTAGHSASESVPAPAQRIASLSKESDKDSPSSRSSTSSWSDEPALTNMDVTTGKIVLAYMEEHVQNEERLETEWNALCAYEADPCATTIAQRPENLQKNRYPHALPYDHARVVLNELCNITESDYINASTIADHDPRNAAYIVTQGPLPHTVPDLWQMVWEQGCVVLVMLTRLGEPDAPLCHRYWPEDGSEIYHIFEVHLVGEYMWCDDYVVRSFYLKNMKTGETRTVTQFHFLSWPDGGVPNATKSLLEFRRKVNKSFRGRSCPIVVHCSDGVGRSGAYVLMDMVLNRIAKGAKEIDIAATLEHIRDQRAGTVANKKQFQFVLQAVADEVQAILKVLQQQ